MEKSTVRLVGFRKSQQSKIQRFMDKQQPIQLDDCEIKKARRGPRMEIMLKGSTAITSSPQTESVHLEEEPILLKELESKEDYEKVSPTTVPTGKKIQEVIIADSSTSSKCTLWEDDIGSLAVGSSYLLKKFHVREYASKKFISKAREESEIFAIYDIGVTASSNEDPQPAELHSALIVGVPQLDTYKSCLRCKARSKG